MTGERVAKRIMCASGSDGNTSDRPLRVSNVRSSPLVKLMVSSTVAKCSRTKIKQDGYTKGR